jgi:hypothetical protein
VITESGVDSPGYSQAAIASTARPRVARQAASTATSGPGQPAGRTFELAVKGPSVAA